MTEGAASRRVMIIGNGGGGKTTLARELHRRTGLPLHHVDTHQFLPGWQVLDKAALDARLAALAAQERWIIDGFGSRDAIEQRMRLADLIVYVDHPIWLHYWWATKRQLKSIRGSRAELQPGCNEFSLYWTVRLFKVMLKVHREFRPWFLARLAEHRGERKAIVHIRSPREWRAFAQGRGAGLSA